MDDSMRTFKSDTKNSQLDILEQEFKKSMNEEVRREKEEAELRRRIQAHRRAILEHEQRERVLQDMKADRQLGAEVVKMARNIIQPELSLSAASTSLATSITDGSMVGGSEGDADEDNGIVGMSEQEKRLMGALRATS